jgi:Cyclin, N-terminal domain
MDRFLCICPIYRQQLQLLGTAALLLASKIRQCQALSVDLLCAYTDHSCTPDQIRVSTDTVEADCCLLIFWGKEFLRSNYTTENHETLVYAPHRESARERNENQNNKTCFAGAKCNHCYYYYYYREK